MFLKYHTVKPDSVLFIKSFRLLLYSPPPASGTFRGVAEVSLCHVERFVSVSETRWWSRAGALSYSRWETLSLKHTHIHTHTPSARRSLVLPACLLQFALSTEIFEKAQLEQNNSRRVPGAQLRSLSRCSNTQSLCLLLYLCRSNPISLFTPLIWLYRCSPVHISLLLYLQIFPSVPLFTPLSVLPLSRFISLLSCHCLHLSSHLYLFIHLPIHSFICISLCQCCFSVFISVYLSIFSLH